MDCIVKILLLFIFIMCTAEKITYLSVEHAVVTYYNPKYVSSVTTVARRFGRGDPVYYYDLNITTVVYMNNSLELNFYFYEFLTNTYKRGFVEMHFKFCDMIHKDKFFGAAMNKAGLNRPCPYPPDTYYLANMTVPSSAIPRNFPFTKGRIYCNMTWALSKEIFGLGQVDMEIKQFKTKSRKNITKNN